MGAGIIIAAYEGKEPRILGLIGTEKDRKKQQGLIYDLPKGTEEPGERKFACAIRETFEETGISIHPSEVIEGPHKTSYLHMWLAIVDINETIVIERNPTTGLLEHEGYAWLTIDEAEALVFPYLTTFIQWAKQHL